MEFELTVRDFCNDDCNVKDVFLPFISGLVVCSNVELRLCINNILVCSFENVCYHNFNGRISTFYEHIEHVIRHYNIDRQSLFLCIRDNPTFIEFQQNYKKRKRYKMKIMPITNVCKKSLKYNEQCLQCFIYEPNIKLFMCYLFECKIKYFIKCEQLLGIFKCYMEKIYDWVYVNKNLFKCFTEMMLNFDSFYKSRYSDNVYYFNNLMTDKSPNEFLHECLCEYHVYNDFAIYFPERQERLLFLHENIYNNYTKHHQTNGICTILADEYLVRILCKFI